jgi:1-acyl-sn-glycerol-3-phosphate acyltransferase
MNRISRFWRSSVIVFCFAAFGIGGTVLSALLFPLLMLSAPNPPVCHQRSRRIVGFFFRLLLCVLQRAGCMRLMSHDAKQLATMRGALILANHPTYIDVVVLLALAPHATCVVKGAIWRNPFYWSIVRAAGYINNASPEAVVDQCAKALASGESLVMFPEGTRTIPGQALKFLRGAAHVAIKADVPIAPVLLFCDPPTLHKNVPWWLTSERPFVYQLKVLQPVPVSFFLPTLSDSGLSARHLTQALQAHFSQELKIHGGDRHA